MTNANFARVVEDQLAYCAELLSTKAEEYTPTDPSDTDLVAEPDGQLTFGFSADDRLRHFKKAAVLMNTTPKYALLGMLSKHIVSVADMCESDDTFTLDRWTEKITDTINYMLLLKAIVIEEEIARSQKNE